LTGSLDLNVSSNSYGAVLGYGVVLVAPTSEANPTATIAVNPVLFTQTATTSSSTVLFTTNNTSTVTLTVALTEPSTVPSTNDNDLIVGALIAMLVSVLIIWKVRGRHANA
jgi:Na+-translocating ferredoxin:NAD+ oxidoreductase RnfD subunit